jgi:hypothetical protein
MLERHMLNDVMQYIGHVVRKFEKNRIELG